MNNIEKANENYKKKIVEFLKEKSKFKLFEKDADWVIPDMTDNPENYTVICDGNVRIYNNETESTEVKNSQYNNIKTDEQYLLIKEKGVPMGECSLFVIRYGSSEHGEGLLQWDEELSEKEIKDISNKTFVNDGMPEEEITFYEGTKLNISLKTLITGRDYKKTK